MFWRRRECLLWLSLHSISITFSMTSATLDKALFVSKDLLKNRGSQGKQSENTFYFLVSDLGLEKTTGSPGALWEEQEASSLLRYILVQNLSLKIGIRESFLPCCITSWQIVGTHWMFVEWINEWMLACWSFLEHVTQSQANCPGLQYWQIYLTWRCELDECLLQ